MKRRSFLGLTASVTGAYKSKGYIESTFEADHPPLVFSHDIDPVHITPTEDGVIIDGLESDSHGTLRLVANKYGDPSDVIREYDLTSGDGTHRIMHPNTSKTFAYTAYTDSDGYVGESNPLQKTDSNIPKEAPNKIPVELDDKHPYSIDLRRGYALVTDRYSHVENPISYQRYISSDRILGYGKSIEYARDSSLLKEYGKRIINNLEISSQVKKIDILKDPIQRMRWISDYASVGKYEYIREPSRTLLNMFGDCKDRTVLLGGLFENALNIHTAILFSPGHMMVGLDIGDLDTGLIKQTIEDPIYTVEGINTEYVPINSTGINYLGESADEDVYAIYDDHTQIVSIRSALKHIKAGISRSFSP